jgi:hypothetical protein
MRTELAVEQADVFARLNSPLEPRTRREQDQREADLYTWASWERFEMTPRKTPLVIRRQKTAKRMVKLRAKLPHAVREIVEPKKEITDAVPARNFPEIATVKYREGISKERCVTTIAEHRKKLVHIARVITRSYERADDVVQAAVLYTLERLDEGSVTFEDETKLYAWLHTIVRRRALSPGNGDIEPPTAGETNLRKMFKANNSLRRLLVYGGPNVGESKRCPDMNEQEDF